MAESLGDGLEHTHTFGGDLRADAVSGQNCNRCLHLGLLLSFGTRQGARSGLCTLPNHNTILTFADSARGVDPRWMGRLVRLDRGRLALDIAKLIDAVQQAVLGEWIDRERDGLPIGQAPAPGLPGRP